MRLTNQAALHCGRRLGPPDKRDKYRRVPPDPRTPGQKPGAAAVENPLPKPTLRGAARLLPRGGNLSTVLSTRNTGRAGENADCSEIKSTVKRPSAWFQSWKPWWSWASQNKQCGCPGRSGETGTPQGASLPLIQGHTAPSDIEREARKLSLRKDSQTYTLARFSNTGAEPVTPGARGWHRLRGRQAARHWLVPFHSVSRASENHGIQTTQSKAKKTGSQADNARSQSRACPMSVLPSAPLHPLATPGPLPHLWASPCPFCSSACPSLSTSLSTSILTRLCLPPVSLEVPEA